MKYQPKGSPYCGPTAVQNALRVYGKKVGIKKLIQVTGADPANGTSEFGLMQGLQEFGYRGRPFTTNRRTIARAMLAGGLPTLLCVSGETPWDHWVVVCVLDLHVTKRYILWDSENSKKNIAENGCHSLTWQSLQKLWRAPAWAQTDPADQTYYGIEVMPL